MSVTAQVETAPAKTDREFFKAVEFPPYVLEGVPQYGYSITGDVLWGVWESMADGEGMRDAMAALERLPSAFCPILPQERLDANRKVIPPQHPRPPYARVARSIIDSARRAGLVYQRDYRWVKGVAPSLRSRRKAKVKPPTGPQLLPGSETMTPERAAKGQPEVVRVSVNVDGKLTQAKVQRDAKADWVSKALRDKKLTRGQAAAADKFAIEAYIAYGSGLRSNIDMSPRGGGGDGAAQASASAELSRVQRECERVYGVGEGAWMHFTLVGVLYRGEGTGDRRMKDAKWQRIVKALDCAIDVWRIPNDPDEYDA